MITGGIRFGFGAEDDLIDAEGFDFFVISAGGSGSSASSLSYSSFSVIGIVFYSVGVVILTGIFSIRRGVAGFTGENVRNI